MPHRQPKSPRGGTAVADNRLMQTVRRSTSAACSQGRVESCLNRLIGRLRRGCRGFGVSTSRQKRCRDHSDSSNTTRTAEKCWICLTDMVTEPSTNAVSNKDAVWIGPGGIYTKTFTNAGEDLTLIV